MEDHHAGRVESAVVTGHHERINDETGTHVLVSTPPNDLPVEQVDHGRQIQPPLVGAQIRDVTTQPLPRGHGGELAVPERVEHVILDVRSARRRIGKCGLLERPHTDRSQPQFTHDRTYRTDSDLDPFAAQDPPNLVTPSLSLRSVIHALHMPSQQIVTLLAQ